MKTFKVTFELLERVSRYAEIEAESLAEAITKIERGAIQIESTESLGLIGWRYVEDSCEESTQ